MLLIVKYLSGVVPLALIVTAFAAVAFRITRKPSVRKLAVFAAGTFLSLIYVFAACSVLFNVTKYGIYGDPSPFYGNYVPFKTVMKYVNLGHLGIFLAQIVGNVIITLPLPFVVWFYSHKRGIRRVCGVSLLITAVIEPVQLLINVFLGGPSNIIDIDDFILNMLGCAVGLLLLKIVNKIYKEKI